MVCEFHILYQASLTGQVDGVSLSLKLTFRQRWHGPLVAQPRILRCWDAPKGPGKNTKKTSPHPTKQTTTNNKGIKNKYSKTISSVWTMLKQYLVMTLPSKICQIKHVSSFSHTQPSLGSWLWRQGQSLGIPVFQSSVRVWCSTWCWVRNSLISNKLEVHVECSSSMIIIDVHRCISYFLKRSWSTEHAWLGSVLNCLFKWQRATWI